MKGIDYAATALQFTASRETHRPHRLMKSLSGLLWETISYPWIDERGRVLVNVRVPGDPTTLVTVRVDAMDPEGRDCLCDATRRDFYFVDSPVDALLRAAELDRLRRLR